MVELKRIGIDFFFSKKCNRLLHFSFFERKIVTGFPV